MPFHLCNSLPTKYSSIENQKIHEYEYKKYLKTLQINNNNNSINSSEQKMFKNRQIYFNDHYLIQRQINLQYRQDKRKREYERIQKENLKFSQRLINAKAFLNRYEQQVFFDKHCQIKQRLQHYPDLIRNQTNNHKSVDSSFLMYNDNPINHKSIKLREKHSKDLLSNINKSQIAQKKLPPITLTEKPPAISNPSKIDLSLIPCSNNINWNKSTNTENLKQVSLPLKIQSSSESNLSDLLI